MSNDTQAKIPGIGVFRVSTIALQLLVACGVLWIRSEIKSELKGYVSHAEFLVYKEDHEKWSREVVMRLQGTVDEAKRQLDRLEAKVDRIAEKRTVSVNPNDNVNALKR